MQPASGTGIHMRPSNAIRPGASLRCQWVSFSGNTDIRQLFKGRRGPTKRLKQGQNRRLTTAADLSVYRRRECYEQQLHVSISVFMGLTGERHDVNV